MSSKAINLMKQVVADPDKLTHHKQNPDDSMKQAGISQQDQAKLTKPHLHSGSVSTVFTLQIPTPPADNPVPFIGTGVTFAARSEAIVVALPIECTLGDDSIVCYNNTGIFACRLYLSYTTAQNDQFTFEIYGGSLSEPYHDLSGASVKLYHPTPSTVVLGPQSETMIEISEASYNPQTNQLELTFDTFCVPPGKYE